MPTRSRKRCGFAKSTEARWSSCTAGPARASQVLREALARGADRAIHVENDHFSSAGGADAFVVAGALADAVRDEGSISC